MLSDCKILLEVKKFLSICTQMFFKPCFSMKKTAENGLLDLDFLVGFSCTDFELQYKNNADNILKK